MSRLYLAFTATAFQTRLAYRGEVWARLFGRLVEVLARIAIWTAVFAGKSSVDGVSLSDMITYSLIAGMVLGAWEPGYLINEVGKAVKTGDVAIHLLKPFHYPLYLFAVQLGNLGFSLIALVLPVIVIIGLIYGIQPPASVAHAILFLAFWVLSFSIFFLLATAIGLLSFWIMDASSLEWFLQGIMSFLSGSVVPLWFFPSALAAVVRFLPFAWISYYPAAVYLGKLELSEAGLILAVGIAWALVLVGAVGLLWSRARHRIVVQGGMSMGRLLSTLWFIAGLHIRARMEYRASLLLGWISQAFGYASAYAAIWLILARFEVLGGWRWPEMALLLGFHILSYSLGASLSFVQMRDMEGLVQRGEFDVLLVKPISPWAYLVFSGLNIGYGGHILLGLGMSVWALTQVHPAWTAWTIPFALAALISAAMLVCAVMTMIGATALIWGRSNYLYSIFFGFWHLARYPLNIFSGAIQVIMLTVMPLAFISSVPVASILGKDIPMLGAWGPELTLIAGPFVAGVAMLHWRYCVRHYQSGGG